MYLSACLALSCAISSLQHDKNTTLQHIMHILLKIQFQQNIDQSQVTQYEQEEQHNLFRCIGKAAKSNN